MLYLIISFFTSVVEAATIIASSSDVEKVGDILSKIDRSYQ